MTLPLMSVLKIIVATSIFFVWVVRYDNIVKEFQEFGLPNELRDIVGISKLSFAVMLMNSNSGVVALGASGITVLMLAAQGTHLKCKTVMNKRLPSFILLLITAFVAYKNLA